MRVFTTVLWCVFCLWVALFASVQFLTTYAPTRVVEETSPEQESRIQMAEIHGIERVRREWALPVFLGSTLLAINSIALVASAWRRHRLARPCPP